MKTVIDWSKAPEGATHFVECTKPEFLKAFFAVEDSDRYTEVGAQTFFRKRDESRPDWVVTPRPTESAAWTGEGLPPADTEIEWLDGEWLKVLVVGSHKGAVVAVDEKDPRRVFIGKTSCYRPIRTPEQIEAEERLAAINYMEIDAGMCATAFDGDPEVRVWVENLIDKGWRKQVPE